MFNSAEFQSVKIRDPANASTKVTANWKIDWPRIIFHISRLIMDAAFGSGFLSSSFKLGGSVARAKAANVSWMRLTHKSCTAVSTDSSCPLAMQDTAANKTALTLTVN